ncbi:RNA 2',3'-cyclic phosphodiesterase [Sphingomonas flavescens]|uniref:RNA 2',3'-cyclic phosphodiesterase n=1 Tax=Sphingomonas flavescens TaxID=3132797 RepID=UPI00280639D1|nr:RNA 2',3'-cyclic phosphodiesterase [Sphingomonas limnosediminicola]
MHRLFVAIRPPEAIRDLLLDAMDDNADFRWQSDDQLHITLRFVGEVERPVAEDLAAELSKLRSSAFELRMVGVGRFDHRSSGVLWAGVEPREPLAALAAKIERTTTIIGLPPERRAYHPHITLARWSGRRSREAMNFVAQSKMLRSPPFLVTEFLLFESRLSRHGAHYEVAARYSLLRGAASG